MLEKHVDLRGAIAWKHLTTWELAVGRVDVPKAAARHEARDRSPTGV